MEVCHCGNTICVELTPHAILQQSSTAITPTRATTVEVCNNKCHSTIIIHLTFNKEKLDILTKKVDDLYKMMSKYIKRKKEQEILNFDIDKTKHKVCYRYCYALKYCYQFI